MVKMRASLGEVDLKLPPGPDLLEAAGRVALAHGQLELMLRMTIKTLTGMAVKEALYATEKTKNWQLRDEIERLFKQKTKDLSLVLKLRAILNKCEALDYIVTQVIADYLATREDPALDGILYPSPQQSDGGSNVVLFHKSSKIRAEVLPEGSTVEAMDGWNTDEGFEIDYHVWEEVPAPKEEEKKPSRLLTDLRDFTTSPDEYTYDGRTETLKINTDDVNVHHVEAVKYATVSRRVARSRTQKSKRLAIAKPEQEIEF